MLQSTKKRDCNTFFAMFSLKVLNVAIVAINSILNSFFSKKTPLKVTKRLLRTSKKALFQTFTRKLIATIATKDSFYLFIAIFVVANDFYFNCNISAVPLFFSFLYSLTNAPLLCEFFSLKRNMCVKN